MRLSFIRSLNSITESVAADEIADFVVLSGPNGSGKSNLLEAIMLGAIAVDDAPHLGTGQPQPGVRMFALAQLVAVAEGIQTIGAFRDRWIPLQQQVESRAAQQQQQGLVRGTDQFENSLQDSLVANRVMSRQALDRMIETAGKRLTEFTANDYRGSAPLIHGVRDPFTFGVSELFLTYHQRQLRNEFLQWRVEAKGDSEEQPLSDEDFLLRYGPPPWKLLDEILRIVGLPYKFDPPRGVEEDLTYETGLIRDETGVKVTLAQLSSGEKTLMAVAMSLYTGSRLGDAIELPRVLLLDEADASLHPSMVQSLLQVVDEIFHKRYGVKVIMTTHSPSTVALAPENCLYVMSPTGKPRLQRATRDDALQSLTVGVPTLSIRNDNRRQVFVESEWDEACYQELFRILRQRVDTPMSLEFIASGKGGNGGAEAVKHLVSRLRAAGNESIQGVVDRDKRSGAPDGIEYMMHRYALENLVLDPLPLGAFLIRERIIEPREMSLPGELRHFDLGPEHAQTVCDFVCSRVDPEADREDAVVTEYAGGFEITVPRWYLDRQGHELERAIISAFPRLNAYRERLKLVVVEAAFRDVPKFAPAEVLELFGRLLGA
jgi:energy-coupling factor transporter ATP-binding protein EcfA2